MVAFWYSFPLESPQDYQEKNGRFYVKEKTKKILNEVIPTGKQDIYILALIETLDEIKGLMAEFLLSRERHHRDIV